MPDTFDLLRERAQGMRARRDPMAWGSLAVEMRGTAGVGAATGRSFGDARIDHNLFRNLSGGQPTSFRVEPGEHTIEIILSRWFRLWKFRGGSTVFKHLDIDPGENVTLVCGIRSKAPEEWWRIRAARLRPVLLFLIGCLVAIGTGVILTPYVQTVLLRAMELTNAQLTDVPAGQRMLGLRFNLVVFSLLVWCLIGLRAILRPGRLIADGLEHQFRYPYYLKRSHEPGYGLQGDS
jgi:hypothetical protein